MKTKLHLSKPINPKALSPADRDQLTQELFQVHTQIFDGVDKDAFRAYVVEPQTVTSKIFKITNRAGALVGYLTFQVYQAEITRNGKTHRPYFYRTEMGILPAYRGGAQLSGRLYWEALKFSLKKGIPEAYYMATPIHPLPYYLVCRDTALVYPQPGIETPAYILAVKTELSKSLQLPAVSATNQFVKKVGWIVKETPAQALRVERSKNPWFQFFLDVNPTYSAGNGLLWLAPATAKNAVLSAVKQLKRYGKTYSRRLSPKLPKGIQPILTHMF